MNVRWHQSHSFIHGKSTHKIEFCENLTKSSIVCNIKQNCSYNSKQISKLDIIDKMKVILCPFPRNVLCLHNISSWCQIIIHWAAVGNMIKLLVPLNMHWIFPPWSVFIITYHNIDNRGLSSPNLCHNKTRFKQLLRLFLKVGGIRWPLFQDPPIY